MQKMCSSLWWLLSLPWHWAPLWVAIAIANATLALFRVWFGDACTCAYIAIITTWVGDSTQGLALGC